MSERSDEFYDGGLAVESYDLFSGSGPLQGDLDFYLELARQAGGPVLEHGVGTGRILLPLAREGLDVTGVDISSAMLAITRRRLDEAGLEAELIQSPMQDFEAPGRYALALIPARAFQHLTEPAEQRQCLERVRRSLRPGALLIMNLFDPRLESVVGEPPPTPVREAADPQTGLLSAVATSFAEIEEDFLLLEAEGSRLEIRAGAVDFRQGETRIVTPRRPVVQLRAAVYEEIAAAVKAGRRSLPVSDIGKAVAVVGMIEDAISQSTSVLEAA